MSNLLVRKPKPRKTSLDGWGDPLVVVGLKILGFLFCIGLCMFGAWADLPDFKTWLFIGIGIFGSTILTAI